MGALGYILGGALQGVGSGMVADTQRRDSAAAATAAERREIAMENLRAKRQSENNVQQGEITRQNATHTGDIQAEQARVGSGYKITETNNEFVQRDKNDARQVERQTSATITIDKAKTANDIAVAKITSGLKMTEAQASAAQDLANRATLAGLEVGETEIAADGSMVIYAKTGKLIGRTSAGVFTPKATDAAEGVLARSGEARQPAPAKTPKAPVTNTIKFDKNGNITG